MDMHHVIVLMQMRRKGALVGPIGVVFASVVVSGCAARLTLPNPIESVNGVPILCAGGAYAEPARLHGSFDRQAHTWIFLERSQERRDVVWPVGYTAEFRPSLVVFDDVGRPVAYEGDIVRGGCPMPGGELIELSEP
jgi:hypothetical protein